MTMEDLFEILSESVSCGSGEFSIRLNPGHSLYKAHFPGNPITPGVCLIKIATILCSRVAGRNLSLCGASEVKFLSPLRPGGSAPVEFSVTLLREPGDYRAMISCDGRAHARMKLSFK